MSVHLDKFQPRKFEQKVDHFLVNSLSVLRQIFIVLMIIYTFICIVSFAMKMWGLTLSQGALNFRSIDNLLTDGLFILIILAIVKSLFLKNSFDYAITLLETGFVVLIRKMILLQTDPAEWRVLFVLGITSAAFFLLIILIHYLKRRWRIQDQSKSDSLDDHDSRRAT
ncbi:MAG: hypothetical protein ACYC3N_04695 [Halothiobacillus sp.]